MNTTTPSKLKVFTAPRLNRKFEVRKDPCRNRSYFFFHAYDVESTSRIGGDYKTAKEAQAAVESDFGMTDAQVAYNLKNTFSPENLARYKAELAKQARQ